MLNTGRWLTTWVVWLLAAATVFAGGSGLNVVVIANSTSTNSLQLANYYCERRQVPPQNVLYINWPGTNVEWSLTDYQNTLLTPLVAMLSSRALTNQIDYIVLSMDIPYRINAGTDGVNGTTSALFYGFKPDTTQSGGCYLADGTTSYYAGTEGVFRATPPVAAGSNSFLVTMITESNLLQAEQIVDQGVAADGSFPTESVSLMKTDDSARNIRYAFFDNVIFDTRVSGNYSVVRINSDNSDGLGESLGFEQGLANFTVAPTTFAPGAMADSLTSYAGTIFENDGQTTELTILQAGATASYGTIIEPCSYLQKFPNTMNYFYQARGFNLAESYYLSVTNPYEGLIVGEPLAAPFATPCSGAWSGLTNGAVLTGTTNLLVDFTAADAAYPVRQVDLFVDGTWFETVTNIPPTPNNFLYVTLNGITTNYVVAPGDSLNSIAASLVNRLNRPNYSAASKVTAYLDGDRVELKSTNLLVSGNQISVSLSNSIGSASMLTASLRASRTNFLDSTAYGILPIDITGTLANHDTLQLTVTKTNGTKVVVAVTNTLASGWIEDISGQLITAINSVPALQGADGVYAEDLTADSATEADFNLQAQSPGWAAAQIQVAFAASNHGYVITPSGTVKVGGNLGDLQPRDHLYVTAGLTNLPCPFALNTTALADGWHELTAVAYEGSNVRTEKRVAQEVIVQNTPLSATLNYLVGGTNTALEATLQFNVTANTNDIASIQLFGTGGSWGVVSNQSTAVFSIAATSLQIGLHPFYAVVTDSQGRRYRTDTKPVRIIGAEPPFSLTITGSSPVLSWLATAGRLYDVQGASNLPGAFQLSGTITPTSTAAVWPITNPPSGQQFYRVRTGQ